MQERKSSLIYLVYASTATRPLEETELLEMLEQSRVRNLRDRITGLLLYKNGQFIQLLEGPEAAVLERYARICADPRHRDILTLMQKPLQARFFPKWSMAFESISPLTPQNTEGYSTFLTEPYSPKDFGNRLHEGLFLLLSFKKQIQLMNRAIDPTGSHYSP